MSAEISAFANILPAEVDGFGYLDFNQRADALFAYDPAFRRIADDFLGMIQRRWSLDPRGARGLGFFFIGGRPVIVAEVAAPPTPQPRALDAGLAVVGLGKLAAVGELEAVTAAAAAHHAGRLLHRSDAAWLRAALERSRDSALVFAAKRQLVTSLAPSLGTLDGVERFVAGAGASGISVVLSCDKGSADKARGAALAVLGQGKADLDALAAKLEAVPATNIVAVALRHWGHALLASVKLQVRGDELIAELPWHAPREIARGKPRDIAQRAVEPGEWGVAQLDFGVPIVEALVALTDVFGAPLDRPAMTRELVAALTSWLELPPFDPRGLTLSLGEHSFIASLHSNAPIAGPKRFTFGGGALTGVVTPWGLATTYTIRADAIDMGLGPDRRAVSLPALGKPKEEPFLRAYAEVSRAPLAAKKLLDDLPIHAIAAAISNGQLDVVITAEPGKAPTIRDTLAGYLADDLAQLKEMYAARADQALELEIAMILSYHPAVMQAELLTPTSIEGDRLTFSKRLPMAQAPALWIASFVGVGAAVAMDFIAAQSRQGNPSVEDHLATLQRSLTAAYTENGTFPVAKTGLVPAVDCCAQSPKRQCLPAVAPWQDEVWLALDFQIDTPFYFRFQYQGEPTEVTVKAVGDLDCDGKPIEYVLHGKVVAGKPTFELRPPPPDAD